MTAELDEIVRKEGIARKIGRKLAEPFAEIYSSLKNDLAIGDVVRSAVKKDERKGFLPNLWASAKKGISAATGWIASVPLYVMAHESLHSIFYKIRGPGTNYLGVHPRVGGGLLSKIFPWISTNIEEVFNKPYIGVANIPAALSPAEDAASSLLPYVVTPIGFLLMRKGKKSAFVAGAGIYIASAPLRHGMDVDFVRTASRVLEDSPGLAAACGAAIAAGVYIASKYAADGIQWASGKISKKGFLKEKWIAAKYYGLAAASSAALAFIAKPNLPVKMPRAEHEKGRKTLRTLYNSGRYEEMLGTGLEGRKEYEEHFMLCYAELVVQGKMEEEDAVARLSGEHRERFYIYLGLGLMHKKKYDEALEAVSEMSQTTENLDQINWAKRLIYSMHGQDVWIKGRNISLGANPGRAREYFEEAMGLYKKALSFDTQKDSSLLKSIQKKIEDIDRRLEGMERADTLD